MFTEATIRAAHQNDYQPLSDLIKYGNHLHRHLDWRPPLDWLSKQPFLLLEKNNRVQAALACPTDPPGIAWIRLFAVTDFLKPEEAWGILFRKALLSFPDDHLPIINALSLQDWFTDLLIDQNFEYHHNIVVLRWSGILPEVPVLDQKFKLRSMQLEDMLEVHKVDCSAFKSIWQISLDELVRAFDRSNYATVIEYEGEIIGYQISTGHLRQAHLARLAVRKDFQRQYLGVNLVADLLKRFQLFNIETVTVNTQHTNTASIALYRKMQFLRTGEEFPVYQYQP